MDLDLFNLSFVDIIVDSKGFQEKLALIEKKISFCFDGKPCTKCFETCVGYKKHQWKNLCKYCKCAQEDHKICSDTIPSPLYILNHSKKFRLSCDKKLVATKIFDDSIKYYLKMIKSSWIANEYWSDNDMFNKASSDYRARQISKQFNPKDIWSFFTERKFSKSNLPDDCSLPLQLGIMCDYLSSNKNCGRCLFEIFKGSESIVCRFLITQQDNSINQTHQIKFYHKECFVCATCNEIPVDLICCSYDGKLYCVRHYIDIVMKRCVNCKEIILSKENCLLISGSFYHRDHLTCKKCDQKISLVEAESNQMTCYDCSQSSTLNQVSLQKISCKLCSKRILDQQMVQSYGDTYHIECCKCKICNRNMVNQMNIIIEDDKMICIKCYGVPNSDLINNTCNACGFKLSENGNNFVLHENVFYHSICFCCSSCAVSNINLGLHTNKLFCTNCYNLINQKLCKMCNIVIRNKYIEDGNDFYHLECFNCSLCGQSIEDGYWNYAASIKCCTKCFIPKSKYSLVAKIGQTLT